MKNLALFLYALESRFNVHAVLYCLQRFVFSCYHHLYIFS